MEWTNVSILEEVNVPCDSRETSQQRNQQWNSLGRVQFGGISREVCLDFVPEAVVGDYVIVHVGFAISVVDREEAERSYELLQSMGVLDRELESDLEAS